MAEVPEALRDALSGRYDLQRELGRGGMATVYLAHHLRNDRLVAIKVLHEELAASVGRARFLREIQIAAKLRHPHILSLLDSDEAGGLLYYVMPYVDDESLKDRIARQTQLPAAEAIAIARKGRVRQLSRPYRSPSLTRRKESTMTRKPIWPAALTLALVAAIFAPSAVQSQTRPAHPSASLLRRLAEAADGYRTGLPVWIVASHTFPHDVGGVFTDSLRAVARADELRDRGPFAVFGRFVTPRDAGFLPILLMVGHIPPTFRDSMVSRPDSLWVVQDVDSLTITVHHHEQGAWRIVKQGLPDALFFTLSAIDKFAVPYYTKLEGPAAVARWRESLTSFAPPPTP